MINKDKKTLIGCINTVMDIQKHKQQLNLITSPAVSHKTSRKNSSRQRFLTQWSDMHVKAKNAEFSKKSQLIFDENTKIINKLIATPISVPRSKCLAMKKIRSNSEVNRMKDYERIYNENSKIKDRIAKAMSDSKYSQRKIGNSSRLLSLSPLPNEEAKSFSRSKSVKMIHRIPSKNASKIVNKRNLTNYTQLMKLGNVSDISIETTKYGFGYTKQNQKKYNPWQAKKYNNCASIQRMRQAAKIHMQKQQQQKKLATNKLFLTQYSNQQS